MPLQVPEERLAHRGQLAEPGRGGQGRLHHFLVEDPPRLGHDGQLELLPGPAGPVTRPLALRPSTMARVPADGPSRPSALASAAAAVKIAPRFRGSATCGHASVIVLAT